MNQNPKMELQQLVEEYKRTHDNNMVEAIINQLKPFIYKNAIRLTRMLPLELDDIRQELIIQVLKRLNSYDSQKGKFLTYLTNTFKGDPTDTLQTLVCKKRGGDGKSKYVIPCSIFEGTNNDSGDNELTLADQLSDKKDAHEQIKENLIKDFVKSNLTETEVKVFELLYDNPTINNWTITRLLSINKLEIEKIRESIKQKCKSLVGR